MKIKNILITCLLLFTANTYAAEDMQLPLSPINMPPAFDAEYVIKASGLNVGKLKVKLTQEDAEHWIYYSHTKATGLAAVFAGSDPVTDTANLVLLNDTIRPIFYERVRISKGADKSERVYYQWDKQLAQSEYKDRKQGINLNDLTTDKFTLQLLIMANINNIPENMTLPIISKAELKDYQIVNRGPVKLETIYGELDTILIERIKDDSSYRIWADPASYGLPLQIERIKEGSTEYIVKIQESSLHNDNSKVVAQITSRPQSSYFQSR